MTEAIVTKINTIESSGLTGAEEACIFTENDPFGLMMALIGMGIVFTILLILFLVFSNTPKLFTTEFKEKMQSFFSSNKKVSNLQPEVIKGPKPEDLSGEVNAAIGAAIHLYRSELHDYEDTVLTINKVSRTYSPWSSKIYGLRPVLRIRR